VPAGISQLPNVWSPWWWVFTSARGRPGATEATAASSARLRASVEVVSTSSPLPSGPTTTPVLLIIQLPSGWM
jgi:hypothetical protein